jgi:hypothetical protein
MRRKLARRVAAAQAAYYVVTGIWPLAHRRSFEALTGWKLDWWLVETVGLLVTSVGVGLAVASRTGRVTPELAVTAAGAAGSLATIDVVYVGLGAIPPTYLADAAVEAGLVAAWVVAARNPAPPRSEPAAAA